jgi:hypothetical protein
MSITRTPIIDDDLSGETGTILNNAWKQELYNQIDGAIGGAAAELFTVGVAGTIALSAGYLTHIVNLNPPAGTTIAITLSGGGGVNGERVVLFMRTAAVVTIAHGGLMVNIATSAPTPLSRNGVAVYTWDAGGWTLTSHEQGAWITAPYAATNFTGLGGMTWTVDAGDVTAMTYSLRGRTLTVAFQLSTTSVGGTLASQLQIGNGAYGGFVVSASAFYAPLAVAYDGAPGAVAAGYITASANGAGLLLAKQSGAAWVAATNGSYFYGQIICDVA